MKILSLKHYPKGASVMNKTLIGLKEMFKESHLFQQVMNTYKEELTRMKGVYSAKIPQSAINRAIGAAIDKQNPIKKPKWVIDGNFDINIGD